MKQNTETWHAWRGKGLGSSDAAAIMNASPYSNLRMLFLEKTGRLKRDTSNWGTRRGHELEDEARSYFELMHDMDFEPWLFEHYQYPFLRASLDGWNDSIKIFLEIKAPSKEEHELAIVGQIPIKYDWQTSHQFLVTNAKEAIFGSYHPDYRPKGQRVWLKPQKEKIKRLAERELWAWDLIQKDIDPSEYDPERLKQPCAKKKYFGDLEIAKKEAEIPFKCSFCVYYHSAKKRMNKRSRDIIENLI